MALTCWDSGAWCNYRGLTAHVSRVRPRKLGGECEKMSEWSQGLPALQDVPCPGLVPEAPDSVQGQHGVVQASPASLAKLVHLCWLPCNWLCVHFRSYQSMIEHTKNFSISQPDLNLSLRHINLIRQRFVVWDMEFVFCHLIELSLEHIVCGWLSLNRAFYPQVIA